MRLIALHDRRGEIAGLTRLPADGPGAARAPEAGQAVAEVDVADSDLDVRRLETEEGAAEALRELRIEAKQQARLVRRRQYGGD